MLSLNIAIWVGRVLSIKKNIKHQVPIYPPPMVTNIEQQNPSIGRALTEAEAEDSTGFLWVLGLCFTPHI